MDPAPPCVERWCYGCYSYLDDLITEPYPCFFARFFPEFYISFDLSWQYLMCFSAAVSQNLRRQTGHWMCENIFDLVFTSLCAIYFFCTFLALDSIFSLISASVGLTFLKFTPPEPCAPLRHAITWVPRPINDTERCLGEDWLTWMSSRLLYRFGTIGSSFRLCLTLELLTD